MFRIPKILPLVFALAAFGIFATGCGTGHSSVRLVHASSDAPSVDVAVDGKTVVTDLAFGGPSPASGYLTVAAGNRRVEVRPTGMTTDLINSNVSFGSGKQYSTIVSGFVNAPPQSDPNVTGIAIVVLTDDNSAPTSGNVKLRVVHDAPGNGIALPCNPPPGQSCLESLDVYMVAPGTNIAGMSPTISTLSYGQASGYQSVAPTNGQVQVIFTLAGDQNPVINQTYNLTAGQIRTLVTVNVQGGLIMATTPLVLADLN
jgi:hypothetical protein